MSERIFDTPSGAYAGMGLTPMNQVIADTKARADGRQNIALPTVADLNLRYVEPCNQMPRGGYMGRIDGKDLPLGDTAIRTACKLIKSRPDYFKQFADPNAFPQSLRNVLDNPQKAGKKGGIIVRTGLGSNGINDEIAAILAPDYKIRDAHEQLEDFAALLADYIGEVRGVSIVEQGWGEKASYRIVVGDNIMARTDAQRGQFMMFVLSMSELGLMPDQTTLGLYRMVCTNGAMRLDHRELLSEWNHKGSTEDYLAGASESIRHLGYFAGTWGKVFEETLTAPLLHAAVDLLSELSDNKLISAKHYDAAERLAVTGPVETQYDFYNLLTRAAQDLPDVRQRETAETSALRLFTEPGGLMEQLRVAGTSRGRSRTAPILPTGDEA
jgi:hypothetical protein